MTSSQSSVAVAFCLAALAAVVAHSIEIPLHRIARAPHSHTALLVPFPRVGKRAGYASSEESAMPIDVARRFTSNQDVDEVGEGAGEGAGGGTAAPLEESETWKERSKRLVFARVGKRYMYAARVGK